MHVRATTKGNPKIVSIKTFSRDAAHYDVA